MANKELKAIHKRVSDHRNESDDDYFYSYSSSFGTFWCSHHTIVEDVNYQPEIPPGIHLGAGNASFIVTQDDEAPTSGESSTANFLIVPEDNKVRTDTTLTRGRIISCGLMIEWSQLEHLPQSLVSFIQKHVAEPCLKTSPHIRKSVLERLCRPIIHDSSANIDSFLIEARANELIASVIAAFSSIKERPKGAFKQVLKARDIIDENLRSPLTQKALAENVGLNVRSLSSHFREHIGVTINQYIANARMERGYKMLEQGLSVSQTAYLVGYSLPYFSEKFQKHFKIQPSQVFSSPNLN